MRACKNVAYSSYDDIDRAIDAGLLTDEDTYALLGYQESPTGYVLPRKAATRYETEQPFLQAGIDLSGGLQVVDDLSSLMGDLLEGLDWWLPEEWLGLDITPGGEPGGGLLTGAGTAKQRRTVYSGVWIENGKVKVVRNGETRTLGYTPRFAKKKFRTKRRRKRLTKRDMYILEVMKSTPGVGALALML